MIGAQHKIPQASIVITNHNYARYVGSAVESALGQGGRQVEVIVVDDGSSDGSLEVLEPFGDRIRLIAQPNGGQGAAFNAGFDAARAPIVIFLDADDMLEDDLVDRVATEFARSEIVRVQFPLAIVDDTGAPTGQVMPTDASRLAVGDVRAMLTRFPDDLVWQPTSGNAFRADTLRQILPMPVEPYRICADYYLSSLSVIQGSVAVLPGIGGSYRVHGQNYHYVERWGLDAIRASVARTSATHRYLIEACSTAGLPGLPADPDEVHSVTALAFRLISLRLGPQLHPITTDRRSRLAADGVRSASGRFDIGIPRRIMIAAWFATIALAPRRMVPLLARPLLNIDDSTVNRSHKWNGPPQREY